MKKKPQDRFSYHVFYTDLRTRTYAFSRREGNRTEYWLVHGNDDPVQLGNTVTGVSTVPYSGYVGSRYGYEGDFRNLGTDLSKNLYVDRKGKIEIFGTWEKMNPILGRYETRPYLSLFSISPPPTFGIDVAVDGSVLASGRLLGGGTFNYHSEADLENLLGISLVDTTLLPIGVR